MNVVIKEVIVVLGQGVGCGGGDGGHGSGGDSGDSGESKKD